MTNLELVKKEVAIKLNSKIQEDKDNLDPKIYETLKNFMIEEIDNYNYSDYLGTDDTQILDHITDKIANDIFDKYNNKLNILLQLWDNILEINELKIKNITLKDDKFIINVEERNKSNNIKEQVILMNFLSDTLTTVNENKFKIINNSDNIENPKNVIISKNSDTVDFIIN